MFEEIRCIISGRVQMVLYRDFAQQTAKALAVVGTAKNLPDGTVEVIAQGMPDNLKLFIERLHEGSVLSKVEQVAVEWRSAQKQYEDFSVLYS